MIELPEARTIAANLRKEILGKKICDVAGEFTGHKFTFYHGDPNTYKAQLKGKTVTEIVDRNFYVEVIIEDKKLLLRDGANVRFFKAGSAKPPKSKLLIELEDGSFLSVTTAMYSFICVCGRDEDMENKYYEIEQNGIGALDSRFTLEYFLSLIDEKTKKLSAKAFLATEQRILGIGNGIVQDILFNARISPRRKLNTMSDSEIKGLYDSAVKTIRQMTDMGGRDTEKNIYGTEGGYKTIMSAKAYKNPCPVCGGEITKENYLGGSVYYCPNCQK